MVDSAALELQCKYYDTDQLRQNGGSPVPFYLAFYY